MTPADRGTPAPDHAAEHDTRARTTPGRGPLRDGLLLGLGTFTAFRVPPPAHVDRRAAGVAITLAAVPGVLLGAGAALVLWAAGTVGLPALAGGLLAVAWLLLATRAFHADGLADTVDGLSGSYDRERSLAIMRTGDVGPAGAAALVVTLGLDAVLLADLGSRGRFAAAALAVVVSRAVLVVACRRGVPPARPEGLGALVADLVPVPLVAGVLGVVALVGAVLAGWSGPLAVAAAALAAAEVARRGRARVGGMTGDLMGATVEVALVAVLLVLAAA